jgi:hypothetical protein
LLFDIAERFNRSGHPMRVVVPSDALLRRVLILTKLDHVLELDETLDDALASLGG